MPLEKAPVGSPGFSRNVETEVKAGKPVAQAVAIAYKMAGEKRGDAANAAIYEENGEFYFPKPGSHERYGPYASKAEATSAAAKAGVVGDADPCWSGYEMVGMKAKDGKTVPNCVPKADAERDLPGEGTTDDEAILGRSDDDRIPAHIRHHGIMIDTSFKKGSNGTEADYWVVQGSSGRFYSLAAAKEVAEGIAKRKAAKADAAPTIVREGSQWIISVDEGGSVSIFRLDVSEYPTKAEALEYALSNPQYTNRKDSLPALDRALAAADALYAKADAERDLPGSSTTEGNYGIDAAWVTNDPTVAKELKKIDREYEKARAAAANLPLEAKVKAYREAKESRDKGYDKFRKDTHADDALLSLSAALGVMKGDGIGENASMDILQSMKSAGLIKQNSMSGASVLQSDLNKFIRKHGKA